MIITARYSGKCECGKAFKKGDPIEYFRTVKNVIRCKHCNQTQRDGTLKPKITRENKSYIVRKVANGLWTYDIYYEGRPPEISVGECGSRRHAEKNAHAALAKAEGK